MIFIHIYDVVADPVGEGIVVGGYDDCLPDILHLQQEIQQPILGRSVKTREGFVERKHVRIHPYNRSEGDSLLLTAGEVVGCTLRQMLYIHHLHYIVDAPLDFLVAESHLKGTESYLVSDVVAKELHIRVLEDEAYALVEIARCFAVFEVLLGNHRAVEGVCADLGKYEPVDELEQSGLAAAV